MKKIKNLLKKFDDNCNNIIELNKKINKIEIDFNNINEKCDILTKKTELLESEISNFNKNFNLMLNFIKEQNKYSNLEMLTLDNNVKKKRVLLMGFYGAPNLGDELMLEVIVSKLKKINNIDLTVMLSENREFDITNYPSLKIIHYPKSILDINILANYFDTVIVGEGALLDDSDYDYYNNQLTLSNSLINICYRMIQFNKQTILYGLSTSNTFSNEEYLAKLDYIFKNCTYISLRDTNSLEVLKKYGKVDNDGSIHVHVDISNWLNTNEETLKRNLLGIMNLCEYGISDEVVKIGHEILNESAKIANLYIDPSRFNNTTGCITDRNIKSCNNIRSISYIYSLYAHTYLSDIQKNIDLKYNSNNEIYYKRKELGLPTSSRKAVWISIRLNIKSIEIRTFPCSLDYETIVEFMIESNKLVKKILNYIEYLGNKAIKADEFWLR